jgi:hypothetical protein
MKQLRSTAGVFDELQGFASLIRGRVVMNRNVHVTLGQRERELASKPVPRAGDERDTAAAGQATSA